jgi:uncharacterized protein
MLRDSPATRASALGTLERGSHGTTSSRERCRFPAEDFVPVSLEEKIICVADKFFSKKPRKLWKEKKPEAIEKNLSKHGSNALSRWQVLAKEILGD